MLCSPHCLDELFLGDKTIFVVISLLHDLICNFLRGRKSRQILSWNQMIQANYKL